MHPTMVLSNWVGYIVYNTLQLVFNIMFVIYVGVNLQTISQFSFMQNIIFRGKFERLIKCYMFSLHFITNFNRACLDKKAHSSRFQFSTKNIFFEGMI